MKLKYIDQFVFQQGPRRQRPMVHLVGFRYLSYSTTLAEHAVHRLHVFNRPGVAGAVLQSPLSSYSSSILQTLSISNRKN